MDEKDKHINPYTASDIRRYLGGEMSAGEMHALEKAAMDDPFLADAIGGMAENEHEQNMSFESGITSLHQRLSAKIEAGKNKKQIPLVFRWPAAAAVLLLLGSSYLGYVLLIKNPRKPADISRVAPPVSRPDSIVREADSSVPQAADVSSPVSKNKRPSESSRERAEPQFDKVKAAEEEKSEKTRVRETSAQAPVAITSALANKDEERHIPDAAAPKTADTTNKAGYTALEGKVAGVTISRRKEKIRPTALILQGLVTDTSGQPIADATVKSENGKALTTTDDLGHFRLKVKSPASNQTVRVSSPGYSPVTQTLTADNIDDNLIQLSDVADSLREVVVTGYGIEKKKATLAYSVTTTSSPVNFQAYVDSHKMISPADSSVHGQETVSFLVHKNGRLSDFKVEQSLSPVHDEELIRLIKTGPSWKISKGKKQRTTVTVNF